MNDMSGDLESCEEQFTQDARFNDLWKHGFTVGFNFHRCSSYRHILSRGFGTAPDFGYIGHLPVSALLPRPKPWRRKREREREREKERKREKERERALIKNKDDARIPRTESISARNHRRFASSRLRLSVFIRPRIYLFGKLLKSVKLASVLSLLDTSKCLYRVQRDTDRQRMHLASWIADQGPTRTPENSEENSPSGISVFQERASFHRAHYRRHETHRRGIARIRLDGDKPPNHTSSVNVRAYVLAVLLPLNLASVLDAEGLALIQLFGTRMPANKSLGECPPRCQRNRRASIR